MRPARLALVAAALLQAAVGVAIAVVLLGELRDIIRDPGRWRAVALLLWVLFCGPLTAWGGLTVVWMPALCRGRRAEWARSIASWSIVLVVAIVYAFAGVTRTGAAAIAVAAVMLALLFAGAGAVE